MAAASSAAAADSPSLALSTGEPLRIAVLTASSNSGAAAVRRLAEMGHASKVRALFRTKEAQSKLADTLAEHKGIACVVGVDGEKPKTLVSGLSGSHTAIIVTPHTGDFAKDAELTLAMIRAAHKVLVKHIVYVGSWTVAAAGELPALASRFAPAEALLRELAEKDPEFKWTVLRSGYFFSNLVSTLGSVRKGNSMPLPSISVPAMDPADIGHAAAAVAVAGPVAHHGKCYNISGPEMLTSASIAEALSSALGRSITHTPVAAADFTKGLPPFVVELVAYLEAHGDAAVPLSSDVETVTGHKPRSFAEWLEENKAAFALDA